MATHGLILLALAAGLGLAACAEMARFYRLPSCVGTFATGAKQIDWQAGVENALSGVVSLLAGADIDEARAALAAAHGRVREALAALGVSPDRDVTTTEEVPMEG